MQKYIIDFNLIFKILFTILNKKRFMKKILFLLVLFLSGVTIAAAQTKTDQRLTAMLQQLVDGFQGDAGIYVEHLKTGRIAQVNADTIFPTASMIKVPIMCGVFDKIEKGELKYDEELIYRDSLLYAGEDILGSFMDGEKIRLSKVQMLSITTSDNTASLWLQHFVGGENINRWLAGQGFEKTRMNSRTAGRQGDWRKYGWGQTTPREMATLVKMIRNGKVISPAASERMYRFLTRIYWDGSALSQIPPYVQVASKTGSVDRARSEVALVNAPHGDYVFCITTKNQKDIRWTPDNEGKVLIRELSAMLWNYFEPKSGWKPDEGMERYEN
jgi:beta-lactamase class A